MRVRESFERADALGQEQRCLPAETYNAMRLLLDYSGEDSVFVPLRFMQYLAVIDREEVIFVDAIAARRTIEFSWQQFGSSERSSLLEPVVYSFVYYNEKALESIKRAQGEFDQSVQLMLEKVRKSNNKGSVSKL